MDFFIKKIFDEKADELVHLQFQKFGRGTYSNRAMVKAKNSGGKYSIGTTSEYGNELVRAVAERLGENKTEVSGVVVTAENLGEQLKKVTGKEVEVKQFMGIKKHIIKAEMSGKDILGVCEEFPLAFMGLSFISGDTELKIKPKSPKSAKPSSSGEKNPKSDFCKLKTTDKNLVEGLLFDVDVDKFKEADLEHVYKINDLIVDYTIKNPKEMREKAKRKGVIMRRTVIDGKSSEREIEFVA